MALRSIAPSGGAVSSAPPPATLTLLQRDRELSPPFLASFTATLTARASLDDVAAELATFRRATDEFSAAARRFQAIVGRALDAHGVGEQMGAPCATAVSALHEWLVASVEQRVPAYLDRLDSGLSTVMLPAYDGALQHQKRVLDALLLRAAHAEAADGLAAGGAAKPEAVVRAVGAHSAHGEAAAAYARREGAAMDAFSRARGVAALELLRGLSDVTWVQSECLSRGAEAASAAREATAEAAAVAAVSLDVPHGAGEGGTAPAMGGAAAAPAADDGAGDGGGEGAGSDAGALPRAHSLTWSSESPLLMPKPSRGSGGGAGGGAAAAAPATGAAAVPLLPGEAILREDVARNESTGQLGTLVCTRYRLLWAPKGYVGGAGGGDEGGAGGDAAPPLAGGGGALAVGGRGALHLNVLGAPVGRGVLSLPLPALATLEAVAAAPGGGSGGGGGSAPAPGASAPPLPAPRQPLLVAVTSDLRLACFSFPRGEGAAAAVVAAVGPLAWAKVPSFARTHAAALGLCGGGGGGGEGAPARGAPLAGWELHGSGAVEEEAARMRSLWRGAADASSRSPIFRASAANAAFALCATYPPALIVPAGVTDGDLAAVAKFRSRGRLPAVVWFSGSVSLSRASQPRAGLFAARSGDDERLLGALLARPAHVTELRALNGAPAPATPGDAVGAAGDDLLLHIMDARPYANAAANTLRGGGAESIANYRGCALSYLNIDNIHVVREALAALRATLQRAARTELQRAHHPRAAAAGEVDAKVGGGGGGSAMSPLRGGGATPLRRVSVSDGGFRSNGAALEGVGEETAGRGGAFFFSSPSGGSGGEAGGAHTPARRMTASGASLAALLGEAAREAAGEEAAAVGLARAGGGKPKPGPFGQLLRATRKLLTGSVKTRAERAAREDEFLTYAAAGGEAGEDVTGGGEAHAPKPPATPRSGAAGAAPEGAPAAPPAKTPKAKAAPPWFKLLSIFIEGGLRVARCLLSGVSVCVHCRCVAAPAPFPPPHPPLHSHARDHFPHPRARARAATAGTAPQASLPSRCCSLTRTTARWMAFVCSLRASGARLGTGSAGAAARAAPTRNTTAVPRATTSARPFSCSLLTPCGS
jgi:hypothetical protein